MNNYLHRVIFFDLGLTLLGADSKQWNPGSQAVLSQLRSDNLRLGVISNTGNLTRTQLRAKLSADFDWGIFAPKLILLSSEVGIEKPAVRIFRLAVERAGVSAEKCLYCSEDLLETLASQRVGMTGARVLSPPGSNLQDFRERLRALSNLH